MSETLALSSATQTTLPQDLSIDGENLLTLVDPTEASTWQRDTLYWVSDQSRVVRHGDWKLQLNTGVEADGVRTWLFDLAKDPSEQNNLATQRPDKVAELKALLDQYVANARPPLWPATLQGTVMVDKTLAEEYQPGDEYVLSPN